MVQILGPFSAMTEYIVQSSRSKQPIERCVMQVKNVWKVIPVAKFASLPELIDALKEIGINIGYQAGRLLNAIEGKFSLPTQETNVAIVTNETLGLPPSIPVAQFYHEAVSQGYKLCTPELGILTRLAYLPSEQVELRELWWFGIAMEPVLLDDGKFYIFRVAVGTRGARFDAIEVSSSAESEADDKWLFEVP